MPAAAQTAPTTPAIPIATPPRYIGPSVGYSFRSPSRPNPRNGGLFACNRKTRSSTRLAIHFGMRSCPYGWVEQYRSTGKERDSETGLDYFDVRYLSGAQGRFTSPDEPLTFADPENPQTWNLYAYGLNSPLLYSDPSGHEPCVNGVNPGTSTAPGLDPIQELILGRLTNTLVTMNQVAEKTQQVVQSTVDWLSSRDPSCTLKGMAAGGGAGLALGSTVGLAGGPTAFITVPVGGGLGLLGGAGVGGIASMSACSSGSGGSGGGSSGQGNRAPKLGAPRNVPSGTRAIDRSGLSREAIHQIKKSVGAGSDDWVGFTREGNVIMNDGSGNSINLGHWTDLTHYR
jgi:RHS repeat-associated protein